jgi:REP element-mobilizing transposase RayT
LSGYDYSQPGYYFVTIGTQNRQCLLGNIVEGKMKLNEFGKIVDKKINELKKYKNVDVDIYCVMPNHIHMIIHLVGADPRVRPLNCGSTNHGSTQGSTPTVGEYVKRLKTLTTKIYIDNVKNNGWKPFNKRLWQRSFYEHIIRNQNELNKIREYIQLNPQMWERDRNNIYSRKFTHKNSK